VADVCHAANCASAAVPSAPHAPSCTRRLRSTRSRRPQCPFAYELPNGPRSGCTVDLQQVATRGTAASTGKPSPRATEQARSRCALADAESEGADAAANDMTTNDSVATQSTRANAAQASRPLGESASNFVQGMARSFKGHGRMKRSVVTLPATAPSHVLKPRSHADGRHGRMIRPQCCQRVS